MNKLSNYRIIRNIIGRGKFGTVYRCKKKDNEDSKSNKGILAIKMIDKFQIRHYKLENQIKIEIKILESINHKNIIHLVEHFDDEEKFYIVTNFIEGGELFNFIRYKEEIGEERVSRYVRQIIDAVEYLHSLNIIHRDIKPENILLNGNEEIVLCDFGWSIISETLESKHDEIVGTVDYLCPEMIAFEGYDYRCDIWDIGILTYELLYFEPPFLDVSEKKIYRNILGLKYIFPYNFSDKVKNFISKALTRNPQDRISISGMKSHPWITKSYSE